MRIIEVEESGKNESILQVMERPPSQPKYFIYLECRTDDDDGQPSCPRTLVLRNMLNETRRKHDRYLFTSHSRL
jgi:hypothetical protein